MFEDGGMERGTEGEHVTVTAVAIDTTTRAVLLVWSDRASGWKPPGGHLSGEDAGPEAAALRELHEESGATAVAPRIYELGTRRGAPSCFAHATLVSDICFAVLAASWQMESVVDEEISERRWFLAGDLPERITPDNRQLVVEALELSSRSTTEQEDLPSACAPGTTAPLRP
jgi:ADP-ribose pyrophosphatase YjhB (NUDIX family)